MYFFLILVTVSLFWSFLKLITSSMLFFCCNVVACCHCCETYFMPSFFISLHMSPWSSYTVSFCLKFYKCICAFYLSPMCCTYYSKVVIVFWFLCNVVTVSNKCDSECVTWTSIPHLHTVFLMCSHFNVKSYAWCFYLNI